MHECQSLYQYSEPLITKYTGLPNVLYSDVCVKFHRFYCDIALWHAIFDGREQLAGLSWEQMKAYLLITFITNALLSWYSETRIANKILDGSVAADLLKPLDFQQARFAETLGSGMVEGGLAAILITVVMIITSGVMVPHTLVTWLLFDSA